ncbi:MAG: hypothetical protein ABI316_00730 [Casimicrobiaceae bacterium]
MLARLVGNSKRREIRKRLGLPENSRLTPEQAGMFIAFENTDMELKKTFPSMSGTQRQVMAREVLRDKGATEMEEVRLTVNRSHLRTQHPSP